MPYSKEVKAIRPEIVKAAETSKPKDPVGVKGDGPIAWGGGAQLSGGARTLLRDSDPEALGVEEEAMLMANQ